MDSRERIVNCDVLIVGGGPGGSSCARTLRQAGADVVVLDKARFPRDKVCAGWITPQVVTDLDLDLDEYSHGRTLQAIHGFRAGVIGRLADVTTTYNRAVSYGIRRCEFDHYLLERSGARLELGEGVEDIQRDGSAWIVNRRFRAGMLVGAGGHFCPVARMLNDDVPASPSGRQNAVRHPMNPPVVVAQEAEFPIDPNAASFAVDSETPELYFSPDLNGYGWCFRKQNYLNVGLGLLDRHACSAATKSFVAYLQARGRVPANTSWRWHGHAYLLAEPRARKVLDDGVLLIGDAAGLAYPQSGEGIRPAIESGMMAAAAIANAHGSYSRDHLAPYEQQLGDRFGSSTRPRRSILPGAVTSALAVALMRVPSFVRHIVLDRWFLRSSEAALNSGNWAIG
jgi:flavin-dependent dehydrogenase